MMEHIKHDLEWNLKAETPLRIIIVGAGIAGLVAAIGKHDALPVRPQ